MTCWTTWQRTPSLAALPAGRGQGRQPEGLVGAGLVWGVGHHPIAM